MTHDDIIKIEKSFSNNIEPFEINEDKILYWKNINNVFCCQIFKFYGKKLESIIFEFGSRSKRLLPIDNYSKDDIIKLSNQLLDIFETKYTKSPLKNEQQIGGLFGVTFRENDTIYNKSYYDNDCELHFSRNNDFSIYQIRLVYSRRSHELNTALENNKKNKKEIEQF